MSKPKAIVIPDLWPWYRLTGWGDIPFPFKPTLLEFVWVVYGARMPIDEETWAMMHEMIRVYGGKEIKRRGSPCPPVTYYNRLQADRIADYFLFRKTRPLRPPAVMTFENPFL